MPRYLTVACDDDVAVKVASLARQFDTTEEEVARQLVQRGLDSLE